MVSAGTDAPLPEALVSVREDARLLAPDPASKSSSNALIVRILPGMSVSVSASAPGYQAATVPLREVQENQRLLLKLLPVNPSRLKIRVVDIHSATPLPAQVTVTSQTTGQTQTHSLLRGELELTYAQADKIEMLATAPCYTSVKRSLLIEVPLEGKHYEFEAKLDKITFSLTARAIDIQTGAEISTARFRLVEKGRIAPVPLTSGPGRAQAALSGRGSYEVFCEAEGYEPNSQRVQVEKEVNEVLFKLVAIKKRALQIPLTVVDVYTGESIQAKLSLTGATVFSTTPMVLSGFAGDTAALALRADGYESLLRRIQLSAAAEAAPDYVFRMAKNTYEFNFRTLAETTRKPVLNARFNVVLTATKQRIPVETTDDQTVVVLSPTQTYTVNVSAEGYEYFQAQFKPADALRDNQLKKDILLKPRAVAGPVVGAAPVPAPVVQTRAFGAIEREKSIPLKNLFFDQSSPVLRPESFVELDQLVDVLRQNPAMRIEIRGHTDNAGDFDANVNLSRNRCQAVIDYLVRKSIDVSRLLKNGRGPLDPLAPNTSEDNRKKNRRVEFVVL